MRQALAAIPFAVVALLATACVRDTYQHCATSNDCIDPELGLGGICQPSGSCSYDDPECPNNQRYGPRAEPPLANQCVEGDLDPDAGLDAVADADFDAGFDAGPTLAPECLEGANRFTATPGSCAAEVCAVDSSCCSSAWSEACVQLVERRCDQACTATVFVGGTSHGGIYALADLLADPTPTALWTTELASGTEAADWADYDGDGVVDLATSGAGDQRIYHGRLEAGELVLDDPFIITTGGFAGREAAWADVDNDGDLDVAFAGHSQVIVVRNDGAEGFRSQGTVFSGADLPQFFELAWGDLDLDGFPELIVNTGTSIALFRNEDGALSRAAFDLQLTPEPREIYYVEGITFCNLDGDVWPEVVVAGGEFVAIIDNDGGTLGPVHTPTFEGVPTVRASTHAACGDFVGDDQLEFLVTGYQNPPRLYASVDGTLAGYQETVLGPSDPLDNLAEYSEGIDVGDLDADGDLDAVIVRFQATPPQLRIVRNAGGGLSVEPPIVLDLPGETRSSELGPTLVRRAVAP